MSCVLVVVSAASWRHSHSRLKFDLSAVAPVRLQIFFSADGIFTEGDSRVFTVDPSVEDRTSILIPADRTNFLRIDPDPGSPPITLCNLRAGGLDVAFRGTEANTLAWTEYGSCTRIVADAGATDPFLVLAASEAPGARASSVWFWVSVLVGLLAVACVTVALLLIERTSPRLALHAEAVYGLATRNAHLLAFFMLLVFGGLTARALPPNGVPDEVAHMSKVVKVEAGQWFVGSGPEPTVDLFEMYGPLRFDTQVPKPLDEDVLRAQRARPLTCARAFRELPTSADAYSPHLYILPAGALAVSCAAGTSFGTFLDAARILNMTLAALLVALGIRVATYGKWSLFLVAMLPMTLSQLASVSADSLTLSMTLCYLGVVSGIAGGRLSIYQVRYWMPFLGILIAFAKPGSAWILVSALFCYRQCPDLQTCARFLGASTALPWGVHIGWTLLADSNATYRPGVDAAANRALLLEDPVTVMSMWINSFSGDNASALYSMMIGRLGWLDVPLSGWAYPLGGLMLAATLWTNRIDRPLPGWTRIACLAAALGSLVLLSLPLLLTWTLPGAPSIHGLQGRYFLPTAAFLLVWMAMRAGPVMRLLLLILVLASPALAMDAVRQLNLRYTGSAQ